MTTDELVKINKDYFIKASFIVAKTAIYEAFPFLSVPPFNLLIDQGINWLVVQVANGLEKMSFFIYIDMRIDSQGKEYVEAAHAAEIGQTEELRKIADEKFKLFVHLDS